MEDRYRIAFLTKGHVDREEFVETLAEVKRVLARTKKENPDYLRGTRAWKEFSQPRDIWVEDLKTDTGYSVDENFKLVEM